VRTLAAPRQRHLEGGFGFLRGGARPPVEEVIRFIDEHKDRRSGRLRWGIEPMAKTLGIAPSTYHAVKVRPPSTRAVRDAELRPVIARVHKENYVAYGADKMWDHLNNVESIRVARCTIERLMRQMGLSGVRRGRSWIRTTVTNDDAQRPADLVDRDFRVDAPNRLWLADLTYVKTHTGWVYAAFIIDAYSRMVVGWQASRSLRSDLAIDALEMAIFNRHRTGTDLDGLIHHSDMGSQYLSIRYSQRLAHNGVVASVGSKGDSYDNAMIESFNGLYKWELIYPHGPWHGLADVEFATLEYVDWFNHRRRHGEILTGRHQFTTPAAHEAAYYRHTNTADHAVTQ
jgi:putative transposase